jgi:hypothetical protein
MAAVSGDPDIQIPLRTGQNASRPASIDKQHRGKSNGMLLTQRLHNLLRERTEKGVEHKCSIKYLINLLLELKKCRAHAWLRLSGISSDETQTQRLQFLAREISRLLHQPDLFVSPKVRARFLSVLGADAELQFTQACKNLLLGRELRNLDRKSRQEVTRKPYKDKSTGWENFLLNGAPGSGYPSHGTIPKSIFQVVPAVGMRIIADFDREEAEIIRFVEEVSGQYVH